MWSISFLLQKNASRKTYVSWKEMPLNTKETCNDSDHENCFLRNHYLFEDRQFRCYSNLAVTNFMQQATCTLGAYKHLHNSHKNNFFDLILITVILYMIKLTKSVSRIRPNQFNVTLLITSAIRGSSWKTETVPIIGLTLILLLLSFT